MWRSGYPSNNASEAADKTREKAVYSAKFFRVMIRSFRPLFFLIVLVMPLFMQAQSVALIPQPKLVKSATGQFTVGQQTRIFYNDERLSFMADYLSGMMADAVGIRPQPALLAGNNARSRSIGLLLDSTLQLPKEGYRLEVTERSIVLKSSTPQGLFYAVQTLLQLLPDEGSPVITSTVIEDEPRFSWRGLMLDVSRHFFTMDQVKRMIDQMVQYKFNILHLHLTDDQGWRMEIKSLPELTRVGAWRVPRTGLWWERDCPQPGEAATYGGFYTQQELKELIAYASARFVQVLPEIDVPGHSLAAIAAYPYLSSTQKKYSVNPGCKFYGIDDNSLCAGRESTFEFLEKVFTEVAEVFPFEYIHIGGDECFKGFWKDCADCQQRMKTHNLKNTDELQSYFIRRLEQMLEKKGKKLMGWDEILEGGLAPKASVMSWRGMDGGIAAAKEGHQVVMSPNHYAYLDLYQGDPTIEPPTYSMLRFKTVYAFEPVPPGVKPSLILGGQGNLWTESVPTFRQVEYMLWPRSFALAEVLWSDTSVRRWMPFVARTEAHLNRLRKRDINFATSFYDAIVTASRAADGSLRVQVDTELEGLEVYYSFDNVYPDHHSGKYTKGEHLSIPKDADSFRVITYRDGKPVGRILTISVDELNKRAKK